VNEYIETNRRNWDDRVPIHLASDFYNVASFKAGHSQLLPVERQELGDVTGKTMLHLQCHLGLDTLSWSREGATVTGVDFSAPAIDAARSLAEELDISARFIETDVYKLPDVLDETFDIVFASYGVLCWLPDLPAWMKLAAGYLNPGGILYVIDGHPLADMLDDEQLGSTIALRYPYLGAGPLPFESPLTYTDQRVDVESQLTYTFSHGLGEIVSAAIEAGLEIEHLREFTYGFYPKLPAMRKRSDGYYELPENPLEVPFMFSLRARAPGL
jgi:SAM-dependent methyltransferase